MLAIACQIAGAVCITVGAALLHPAAGFILGGVFLTMFGLAAERGGN